MNTSHISTIQVVSMMVPRAKRAHTYSNHRQYCQTLLENAFHMLYTSQTGLPSKLIQPRITFLYKNIAKEAQAQQAMQASLPMPQTSTGTQTCRLVTLPDQTCSTQGMRIGPRMQLRRHAFGSPSWIGLKSLLAPASCCNWPGTQSSVPDKSASAQTLTISPSLLQMLRQEGSTAPLALTRRR